MNKKVFFLMIIIIGGSQLFSSSYTDKKIAKFVDELKEQKYELAIVHLLANSALESIVIDNQSTMKDWINKLESIHQYYGDYLSFEKVSTTKLGELEQTIYLVYCEFYAIQVIIAEYNNGKQINIINMEFDDEVIDTLNTYGTTKLH
ncbi:MAG: hypothetical protein OCD02_13285 [Spirochaetaceae bacterium]